jgi:hypothetical protein
MVNMLLEKHIEEDGGFAKMPLSNMWSDGRGTITNCIMNLSIMDNVRSGATRWHLVFVDNTSTTCDPHDVQNPVCRYVEHPPVSCLP